MPPMKNLPAETERRDNVGKETLGQDVPAVILSFPNCCEKRAATRPRYSRKQPSVGCN